MESAGLSGAQISFCAVMFLVLSALFSLLAAPFPIGALSMPELCHRLTAATGVTHGVDGALRDYPVFVSVHQDDPKRVEALVASALGGEWQMDGKVLRLVAVKPKPGEGIEEFRRLFQIAAKGGAYLPALPLDDLYRIAPGDQVRYGYPSGPLFHPFEKAFAAKVAANADPIGRIVVRRDSYGSFTFRQDIPGVKSGAFSPGGQIQFKELPAEVALLLGDLKRPAMTAEEASRIGKFMNEPANLKIDWRNLDATDPIASFADLILKHAAEKVAPDVVVALPDLVLMCLPSGSGGGSVGEVFGSYSSAVEWRVVDGAVVGKLPECERSSPAQTRRSVLSNFVMNSRSRGIPTPADLTTYLAGQRAAASNTWADVILLVMGGVVIDQAFISDHPYNLRFADRFTAQDWAAVRTGRPFLATALSTGARTALMPLLLSPRTRLQQDKIDPATWLSLSPEKLQIVAQLIDEDVVIGWTGFGASVESPRGAFFGRDRALKLLGREPLYQPARRRKVKLTIGPIGMRESVETGFSEVTPVAGTKPTPWAGLPESVRKAASSSPNGDVPVPVTTPPTR